MNDIIGFEAGVKELQRLLEEAEHNIREARDQGADKLHEAVLAETARLVEFTNRTEPKDLFDQEEVKKIRKLDQMADEARREIFGDSAEEIIGRIQGRASALNRLANEVKAQTEENLRKVKEIRLVPVRKAIDAATDLVGALKAARDTLLDEEAGEAAVKSGIDDLVSAIEALEKAARDL